MSIVEAVFGVFILLPLFFAIVGLSIELLSWPGVMPKLAAPVFLIIGLFIWAKIGSLVMSG